MRYVIHLAILQMLSRPAGSLLSIMLFAIGLGLISFINLASFHIERQAVRNLAGIDLVAGAKGSPMQLILSSVIHMDYPTGNIKLSEAETIARHPLVKNTIPVALGDNYYGFRIVGTKPGIVAVYQADIHSGNMFSAPMEVCLGADVAKKTGLKLHDNFTGVHGFYSTGHAHEDHVYTVTGILKPTGTVIDRLILTPVESVWMVHEHHHEVLDNKDAEVPRYEEDLITHIREKVEAGEDITAEEMQIFMQQSSTRNAWYAENAQKEITALLIFYHSPAAAVQLPRLINETTNMQAASPALEVNRLFSMLGYGFDTLKVLAWVIILISAIQVFIHLLNTFRQETAQLALLRVMGGSRLKICTLVLSQSFVISLTGWVAGLLLSRVVWNALPAARMLSGNMQTDFQPADLILLAYALLAGLLAALWPAWKAYQADIHHTLKNRLYA